MGMGQGLRRALAALATDRGAFTADQQDEALDEFELFLQRSRERGRLRASMTRREREVTALIAAGLTTRQMATRLGLAEGTVERHITRAYRKLGVRTRVQAAARAREAGIADLEPRSGAPRAEVAAAAAG